MSDANEDCPVLLSAQEVAGLCGVSADTVKWWAANGRLAFVRTPGGHRRFPAPAVVRFAAEREPFATDRAAPDR